MGMQRKATASAALQTATPSALPTRWSAMTRARRCWNPPCAAQHCDLRRTPFFADWGGKPCRAGRRTRALLRATAGEGRQYTENRRGCVWFAQLLGCGRRHCHPPVLGSRATDVKCGIGGERPQAGKRRHAPHRGMRYRRALADHYGQTSGPPAAGQGRAGHPFCARAQTLPLLRTVPGPQDAAFTAQGYMILPTASTLTPTVTAWPASWRARRWQCTMARTSSDGIVPGSVQVSADGQPIVMLADHQTTGGYAKLQQSSPLTCPRWRSCVPVSEYASPL